MRRRSLVTLLCTLTLWVSSAQAKSLGFKPQKGESFKALFRSALDHYGISYNAAKLDQRLDGRWKVELRANASWQDRSPLHPSRILNAYTFNGPQRGMYYVVDFDRSAGAKAPDQRGSKFVILQDIRPLPLSSDGRTVLHLLGVPTPNTKPGGTTRSENISWLDVVSGSHTQHLGRMVRDVLRSLAGRMNAKDLREYEGAQAYINMPGAQLTVPTLHVHGVPSSSKRRDWVKAAQQATLIEKGNGFAVYASEKLGVFALADAQHGGVDNLSAKTDALLGQMVLAAQKAALDNPQPLLGRIEINQNGDNRIVVRVREAFSAKSLFSMFVGDVDEREAQRQQMTEEQLLKQYLKARVSGFGLNNP